MSLSSPSFSRPQTRISLKDHTPLHWRHSRHLLPTSRVTFTTYSSCTAYHNHSGLQPAWNSADETGFGQRSFTYSAPHVWNSLPHVITGNLDVTANISKRNSKRFTEMPTFQNEKEGSSFSEAWRAENRGPKAEAGWGFWGWDSEPPPNQIGSLGFS